jgi:hypothetical protein
MVYYYEVDETNAKKIFDTSLVNLEVIAKPFKDLPTVT